MAGSRMLTVNFDPEPRGGGNTPEPLRNPEPAPEAGTPPTTPPVSEAAVDWGLSLDGTIGLVQIDPYPEEMLSGLRAEFAAAIRGQAGAAEDGAHGTGDRGDRLAKQFDSKFVNSWVKEEEPHVRDEGGASFTVEYEGTRYAVDVRAIFVNPVLARDLPAHDPAVSAERPMTKQEERVSGSAGSQHLASTSNYRSLPSFLTRRWVPGGETFSPELVITHNQLATASSVGTGVMATVVMRTRQNSVPYDFTVSWQYRIGKATDDGFVPEGAVWQNASTQGETRVFIPDHLAMPKPVGDLRPASLDDIPLYSTDTVKNPKRALLEARRTLPGGLTGLSEASQAEVKKFLGEKSVRGNIRLARDKAYISDPLYRKDGKSLGVLRLDLEVDEENLRPRVPSEKIMMENYLGPTTRLAGTRAVTNAFGVKLPLSGTVRDEPAVTLTGVPFNVTRSAETILGSGGSTVLFRSLKSSEPHLQVDADARFTLTLVRADRPEQKLSSWDQGLVMRVQTTKTADGIPPKELPQGYLSPDGRRYAPPEIADLRSIGMSATPHLTPRQIAAMEPFWESVEAELRRRGFLPGTEPESEHSNLQKAQLGVARFLDWNAELQVARLNNYRSLTLARSRAGQEAMFGDKLGRKSTAGNESGQNAGPGNEPRGGYPLFFDKPGILGGNERLELRLSETGSGEPAYLRTVGGVQNINFSNTTMPGSESRAVAWSGSAEGEVSVSVEGRLPGGEPVVGDVTPVDLSYTLTKGTMNTVTSGIQHEQALLSSSGHRMDVFSVPRAVDGSLYGADPGTPVARFTAETDIDVWVPEQRTSAAPFPRPAEPGVPTARLLLTKAEREQAEYDITSTTVPVPDTAVIDDLDISVPLQQALRDILAGREHGPTRPGEPAPSLLAAAWETLRAFAGFDDRGPLLPTAESSAQVRAAESSAQPEAAAGRRSWLNRWMFGEDMGSPASNAQEVGQTALAGSRLVANGQQVLKGTYIAEHLSASGMITDTDASIELRAVLRNPRLVKNPTYNAKNVKEDLAGGFPAYTEHDMYGPEGASVAKQTTHSLQYAPTGSATFFKGPAEITFTGQYGYKRQRSVVVTDGTNAQINRVDAEDDVMFRLQADLALMLVIKRGTRNIVVNALPGQFGVHKDVAVWIEVPDGAQMIWTGHQLRENLGALGLSQEELDALAPNLPRLGEDELRLPESVRAGDGLPALAVVTDIKSLNAQAAVAHEPDRQDTPVAVTDRDHFLNEIITLVEQHTPGALTPGRAGYVHGLKSDLAVNAGPLGMRALPGRGRQVLHYTYADDLGGSAWYELELTADVKEGTDLTTLYGRDVNGPKGDPKVSKGENGVENYATASGDITGETLTTTRTHTYGISAAVKDAAADRLNSKTALTGSLARGRDTGQAIQRTGDDRTALRSSVAGAQFDIPYVYRATLRKGNSDPTVFGVPNKVVSVLTDAMRAAIRRGAKPLDSVSSLQRVRVRFSSLETPAAAGSSPEIEPRLKAASHISDPFRLPRTAAVRAPGSAVAQYTAPDRRIITLHENLQVQSYSGIEALHTALGEVAPQLFRKGSRLWPSQENATIQLAQILRRGKAQLGNTRGEFGLLSEPGSEPSVTVEPFISGLRRLNTGGIPIDRMTQTSTTVTATADTTSTPSLGISETLGDAGTIAGGADLMLLDRKRTVSGQSAAHAGIRREIVKAEPNAERADGTHGVRADLTLKVTGPGGAVRYVTGTAYLRLTDQDVLGHGIVGSEPFPGTFDMRALGQALENPGDPRSELEALADYVRARIASFENDAAAVEPQAPVRASYPSTIHLWLDLREDLGVQDMEPVGALLAGSVLAQMLNGIDPERLEPGQAVAGKAVQVALRDDSGVRQVLFDPAGRLRTDDPAAAAAMAKLVAAAREYVNTPEAERTALPESSAALLEAALNAHTAIGLGPRASRLYTSNSTTDALQTSPGRYNPFREYGTVQRILFPFSSRVADRVQRLSSPSAEESVVGPRPSAEPRPQLAAVPGQPLPFAFSMTDVVIDLSDLVREGGPDSALALELNVLREMSRVPDPTAIDQQTIEQTAERIVDALMPKLLEAKRGHSRLIFRIPTGDVLARSAADVAQATAYLLNRRVHLVSGTSTIVAEFCGHA